LPQVADLNALAELGKVYQDSLALSAQLRNLSSFRLQQDKVLGRGSLAVVQEGEQQQQQQQQLHFGGSAFVVCCTLHVAPPQCA
jgi:hypothetical protein